MDTVPDNVRGPDPSGYGKCHREYTVPVLCIGIRVKRCGMQSSVLNVRAHRGSSNTAGPIKDPAMRDMINPTESKTA